MDNYHNVKNQGNSLEKCRSIFRHDELIEVLESLYEARLSGVEVTEILSRIGGDA